MEGFAPFPSALPAIDHKGEEAVRIRYDKRTKLYLPDTVRPMNKGYSEAGASWRKKALKGFDAHSGSPHEDIDFNNYTLRQRARMLYMASPVATSAIKTNRTNVVGCGLQLRSRIDRDVLHISPEQAEEWEKNTEREFRIWAENKRACDATGMNDFYGLQQLALATWMLSGDCIGLLKQYKTSRFQPYALHIQLIEPDRVATPVMAGTGPSIVFTTGKNQKNGNTIYDGVEIDKNGMVVAYHIRSDYPFEIGTGKQTEWSRVTAFGERTGLPNVVHIMDSERCEQYRGVTYLAQVIEPLLQLRRYTDSELMAAVVESFFTAFVKTESSTEEMPFNQVEPDPPGRPNTPNEYSMGPGQVNVMEPGEDVVFADPKRPAGGYQNFVKAICSQIGAALEIPADLLLKEFNSSYSASRAALLEAWKAFKMRRDWLSRDFCRPVYEVWMSEAVARGRITAPGFFENPAIRAAYLGSEWLGPSQGQLDPVKENTAEILACGEGFSTHEQSTVKVNGGSWDNNIEVLQRENEKMNGQPPDPHQGGGGAEESPHDPQNAREQATLALRQLIIEEQIKQSIQGGQNIEEP